MAQIVPAILETTKEGFLDKVSRVVKIPGVERIQVDFGDGVFVPNTMLPASEMDALNPAFTWEAHLMVQEPRDFLDYQICGFKTIIIHFEAFNSPEHLFAALEDIKSHGLEAAICLKPETPVKVLEKFHPDVKRFQLMSVDPGFQGAEFLPKTYERLEILRKLCPNAILQVDGGVNETNIKKVIEAGADFVVVGSSLVKAADINEEFEKLNSQVSQV